MNINEISISQSILLEKDENIVEMFHVDQANLQVRNLFLIICLVGGVFLLSMFFFGYETPLWGNFLGACVGASVFVALHKIGMLPKGLNRKVAPLILTDRSLITPQAEKIELQELGSVEATKSRIVFKSAASTRSLVVNGLIDADHAATAIRKAI